MVLENKFLISYSAYNSPGPTGLGLSGIEYSPYSSYSSYHDHDHHDHHETISDAIPTGATGAEYSYRPPTIAKRSIDERQFQNINEDM